MKNQGYTDEQIAVVEEGIRRRVIEERASRHSAGPWVLAGRGHSEEVIGADGHSVAMMRDSHHSDGELAANARLIAAAPEMYEALKAMERIWPDLAPMVKAALLKAEGK